MDYNVELLPFMVRKGEQQHVSEAYVTSPPALVITDNAGDVWTLGFDPLNNWPTGEYEFDVVRNGNKTGEYACRIEFRKSRVCIFGHAGWRQWNGRTFV